MHKFKKSKYQSLIDYLHLTKSLINCCKNSKTHHVTEKAYSCDLVRETLKMYVSLNYHPINIIFEINVKLAKIIF